MNFSIFLTSFCSEGVPLRPLGRPLVPPKASRCLFFWSPWAPLCAPLECWRSSRCPIGHTFPPQTVPKERKVGTVCRRRVLVAFKRKGEPPLFAKCHENIINSMALGGATSVISRAEVCSGAPGRALWSTILVTCAALWATLGGNVSQLCLDP